MDDDERRAASDRNGAGPAGDGTRVLVTGAAGFIGSHLCERLLDAGCSVWGLDRFESGPPGPNARRRNLASALRRDAMHLVEGDVRDAVLLDGLLATYPFDAVVHLAAMTGEQASMEAPGRTGRVNVGGTLSLLESLARHGVERLVFGSTATVYGRHAEPPFRESDAAARPASPNAASKRAGELYCHAFHATGGLSVHCLRVFTAYGPRQRPDLEMHRFARLLRDGEPLPVFGEDGFPERDFVWIGDVVEGFVRSLGRLLETGRHAPEYEVVNLGSGRPVGLDRMAAALAGALGVGEPRFERLPAQPWDVPRTHASVERARELLGWRPETPLEEGIEAFAGWFLGQPHPGAPDATDAVAHAPDPADHGGRPTAG